MARMLHRFHESAMNIRHLEPAHDGAWDAYVENQPGATFFHRTEWRSVIESVFGHRTHFLYAERAERVCGVLPLAEVRSVLFGHALTSTPFCVYGGAVGDDAEVVDALERQACELAREIGVDYLELRNLGRARSDLPTKSLYVTFRKPILPEVDANLRAIPRKQRAMVRKGIDAGLVSADLDVDSFFRIYATSVRNLGTPVYPKRYFKALQGAFGERCRILGVRLGDTPVAAVMSFYFRDQVLPYYGGGTPAARACKGFDFMYWELMRRSCEEGLRVFDYGRSKVGTGSYAFKKNWGFEPEPLHYQYHLVRAPALPDVNPLNPKYRMFVNLWKHLPLPIANLLGPMLARDLG
jgi:FemAB-related protein (PEP-CTERM system-associated)